MERLSVGLEALPCLFSALHVYPPFCSCLIPCTRSFKQSENSFKNSILIFKNPEFNMSEMHSTKLWWERFLVDKKSELSKKTLQIRGHF
jgi:hypothetical protein